MVAFTPLPPPPGHLSGFLTSLQEGIKRTLLPLVSKDQAVDRIILLSPNGTSYNVRVTDAGALSITVNSGNSGL